MKRVLVALLVFFCSAGTASAAPAEVRGYHFNPEIAVDTLHKQPLDRQIKLIAEAGFNTLYVDFVDEPWFEQGLIEAHRQGLLVIARIKFPRYAAQNDPLALEHRDWFTGATIPLARGGAWLNPFHAEYQQSVINHATKIAQSFDVDGIQLSMQLEYPTQFGFDPHTKSLYSNETDREVDDKAHDEEFMRWRVQKISEFALRFVTELRGVQPYLILSTEVDRPGSEHGKLTDWTEWTKWCECGGKHWDEIAVRYPEQTPETKATPFWKDDIAGLNAMQKMFVTVDVSAADFNEDLGKVRDAGLAGHYFRSSRSVVLPAGEDTGVVQLIDQYQIEKDGRARHPLKPSNWREPPIAATREGDVFVAELKEGNRYHVIVKKDGIWSDIGSFDFKPGRNTFLQQGDALELMVDRRP